MQPKFKFSVFSLICLIVLIALGGESSGLSKDRSLRTTTTAKNEASEFKINKSPSYETLMLDDYNDDYEQRIVISEPFKSLIQTSARFALSQTDISNHIELDTAIDLMSDIGYVISKPSNLFKVIKTASVGVTTVLISILLFPGAIKHIEAAWRDPSHIMNMDRYLSNGLSESTVLGLIGSSDALSRVGLYDRSCRERSICQLGEVARCVFPETADHLATFARDNFARPKYRHNKYVKAFLSGFEDRNCTEVGKESQNSSSCIGNLFSSMILSRWSPKTYKGYNPKEMSENQIRK